LISLLFCQSCDKDFHQSEVLPAWWDKDSVHTQLLTEGPELLDIEVVKYISHPVFKLISEYPSEVSISVIICSIGVGFSDAIFLYIILCGLLIQEINAIVPSLHLFLPVRHFVRHHVHVQFI
jgi:hypothetical protein